MIVMSTGEPHQFQDLQTRFVLKWLTSCIMSRIVLHCPCVSGAVAHCGTCSGCRCVRMSADAPLTALRRAPVPAGHAHAFTRLCMRVCMCMGMCSASLRRGRPGSAVALSP